MLAVFEHVKSLSKEIFCLLVKALTGRNQRRNSLLVVQIAGIGDLIVCNSILIHLRTLYPDHHIAYLVKESHATLVEGGPFIDEIIKYPDKTISKNLKVRWNFFSRIVKSGFDTVIYPYRSRTASVEEIVFLTGAGTIISYEGNETECNTRSNNKYTKLFPHDQEAVHELETHKLFMEWLGYPKNSKFEPVVWTADNDKEIADVFKKRYQFDFSRKPYVVFFPGALSAIRFWQTSKYVQIGQKILQNYPSMAIVICGGAQEVDLGKEICGQLSGDVLDLCGKTDLRELTFLLKNSDLYLGSETGAYHLAVALGIPNLCILGGGVFGRFAPWNFDLDRNMAVYNKMDCFGCNWTCRFSTARCIDSITAEMVWDKVIQALNNSTNYVTQPKQALNK